MWIGMHVNGIFQDKGSTLYIRYMLLSMAGGTNYRPYAGSNIRDFRLAGKHTAVISRSLSHKENYIE